MKKLLLGIVALLILLPTAVLLWWPLPLSRQDLTPLTRASIIVSIPPELEQPKTTSGLLSWLGVRNVRRLARPEVGTTLNNITSTGYASSRYQTDLTPCVGATGLVRAGTVASNFLPPGTLLHIIVDGVKIPGLFIVEDRMADRFSNRIDIWFAQTSQALNFGKRKVEIVIVGYGKPGQLLAEPEKKEDSKLAQNSAPTLWETVKLRARSFAQFLATRGEGVNRHDENCLKLQEAEVFG